MSYLDKVKEDLKTKQVEFKDNMVLTREGQPHTPAVADLTEFCSGVITANYYFVARYFDLLDDSLAENIVAELKKLQNTDESDIAFGCMRWYREEEYVFDTNGAFFVLLPLALIYKLCGDRLTENEKADIKELLKNASVWFKHATEGSLHYCNKIMSDGALLALIADITGACKKECEQFWTKWHKYADDYGWGWGENTSDCYSTIMLNALNATIISTSGELKQKAEEKRAKLLDYILYQEGKEFVPSIRTYNFSAKANYGGAIYSILNGENDASSRLSSQSVPDGLTAILIHESGAENIEKDFSNVRNEKLFNDSCAYTWKSGKLRLGSVNHFPVMPASYQNMILGADGRQITYGLGWQSMPVSAMLDENIGFLRIRSKVGENEHSHPVIDKHSGHLFNRIFEDGNTVTFSTISSQDNNIAVVSRYANKIANTASFLCDEWCIDAEIKELEVNDKKWFIADGKKSAVALLSLNGISADSPARKDMKTYISENGKFKTITTEFYSGENKLIFAQRIESAWVIVALENKEDAKEYLASLEIKDEIVPNIEITLNAEQLRRKISCGDGKSFAELFIDPTAQFDF